jgi:hypothetical protein
LITAGFWLGSGGLVERWRHDELNALFRWILDRRVSDTRASTAYADPPTAFSMSALLQEEFVHEAPDVPCVKPSGWLAPGARGAPTKSRIGHGGIGQPSTVESFQLDYVVHIV